MSDPETGAERVVYIVDDDEAVRRSLQALLRAKGFNIRPFEHAEAFLQGYQSGEGEECALVDVRMPGMTGLELQKTLVSDGKRIPIVIMTGHGDVPMAVEAMKAGAVDFIEKPFTTPQLFAAVERAFERAANQDEETELTAEERERLETLTNREREVLDFLAQGHTNKVIAYELDISQRTVEVHRARIKEKLRAQSLSDLIRLANAWTR